MQYKICEGNGREQLEQQVNENIQKGWLPQGGISVVFVPGLRGGWWYFQSMVRTASKAKRDR